GTEAGPGWCRQPVNVMTAAIASARNRADIAFQAGRNRLSLGLFSPFGAHAVMSHPVPPTRISLVCSGRYPPGCGSNRRHQGLPDAAWTRAKVDAGQPGGVHTATTRSR